ncbi:MAG TPA: A/G-specific adenine glycosylase [Candidatus Limnocylindria bacterium]|nr:A/G-specific adenine glycosylase [Candidatus Limnocylindria bacterium]
MYTAAGPLRRRLLRWYDRSGRDLPWRRTRDPYAVLVSEVMLQQTQVARVVPAYDAFLRRFPTLRALSRAPLGDVLRAWSGLGYNRRARDLHRIARAVPGALPLTPDALDALPGVGAYTAGAVACFGGGVRTAFADTNIRRVLGRIVLGRIATEREAVEIDRELLPRDAARWHHALMDLGATVCVARAPRCPACPVAAVCRSRGRVAAPERRREAAFATSTRRLRGLALRRLVAAPGGVPRARLERDLADARATSVVDGLARDGLVTISRGRVRLPG